ncbi:MAG: efflux RND transporter periplasmic adaptor subunit [Chromatiaceae bacterium]|nr:efflux RND transporter periplasmic adaptor subunit [Chromatiaceae bacterium]
MISRLAHGLWLLVPATIAALWYLAPSETPAELAYTEGQVQRGELVATVSATGTLSPLVTVLVGSQVSGTIQSLHADFNAAVTTGEVIAQIEPALFRARVAEAEAKLQSAEAQRDKAWVTVLDARRHLERQTGLQARSMVSESDMDAARFAVDAATVEHRIREAAVAEAVASLEHERLNLQHTTIRTPIDGVVISRDVDVGQTVAASLQAPTLFTIAQDLRQMQIETAVDEAFIGSVAEGQPVSFTVFAYPKRRFQGRLAQVRLQPKVEAGVVKYNCIIDVDNTDLALKPGMTATVAIEVDRREDALKVANAALRFVPTLEPEALQELRAGLQSGEGLIWVPSATGLEPRKVRIGLVGERETELLGEGLVTGMPIALPQRKDERRPARPAFSLF